MTYYAYVQNLMTNFSRSTDIIGAPKLKMGHMTLTMILLG